MNSFEYKLALFVKEVEALSSHTNLPATLDHGPLFHCPVLFLISETDAVSTLLTCYVVIVHAVKTL